jgi:PBP1b-binding outer membrane lipoprotein LpoB
VLVKRFLVVCVLALSVLGGCASTGAPAKATQAPATATKAPVAKMSKEEAATAFASIVKSFSSDPEFSSLAKAVEAEDYKTARGQAPKVAAGFKTAVDAIEATRWPDEIQSDMDSYASGLKKFVAILTETAGTATDAETKRVIGSYNESTAVDSAELDAASKRLTAYFGAEAGAVK